MKQVAEGIYRQSGVIPFRVKPTGVEVLLVTSSSGRRWVIPKGIVEENLSPGESAVKEAFEEAGIKGTLYTPPVGSYDYNKWGGTCTVEVFLLEVGEVLSDWPESDKRDRRWWPAGKVLSQITDSGLRDILSGLEGHLESRGLL